ncbi:MAG: DUF4234 domain-containing protein [Lachnospiraceae bacterium]|nr:DUF4234 domain-containing protein [Lachnospiraceae bacterium]
MVNMKCEKCGAQVSSDNKYCPNCGREIIFRKELKTSDSVAIGDNYNVIAGFLVLLYFILSFILSSLSLNLSKICYLILAIMLFAKSSKQYLAFVLLLITVISTVFSINITDYLRIASWLLIFVLTAINIKFLRSKINKLYFLPAVFQAIYAIYITYLYRGLNSFGLYSLYWLKEWVLVFAMLFLGYYVIIPEQIKVKNNGRLKTERSLILYILLSIATFGLYGYYFIYSVAKDVNVVCKDDEEKTPGLIIYLLLSFLTLGIYSLYWEYKVGNRIQKNAVKYDITIVENGSSILLWRVFGLLICGIGTFIGTNILIKNTNAICSAYNKKYQLF